MSSGTWTIKGAGSDIWGSADQFHYVWRSLSGDGSASVHVTSQSNTDQWAKAGVMLRQTTSAGSPFYDVVLTPSHGIVVQYRATQGGTANQVLTTGGGVPSYVKIGRAGSTYTAYTSTNGVTWTAIPGSGLTLNLTTPVLAGVAVTSHTTRALSTVVADSLTVSGATAPTFTLLQASASALGPMQGSWSLVPTFFAPGAELSVR